MGKNEADFPVNSIRICVDGQESNEIHGKICGVALKGDLRFSNVADLLVKIDDALNFVGTPQSYQICRTFEGEMKQGRANLGSAQRYRSAAEIRAQEGAVKTVDIIIFTRQHTSWQGIVKNAEGKVAGEFKSDLELMKLVLED